MSTSVATRSWGSDRPLSLLQERMWLLGRLHPGTDLFTLPVTLEFKGKLHLAPLGGALSATIARQDALSGRVVEVDGTPRHQPGSFPSGLPLLDGAQELPPQVLTGGALATARLVRLERNLHQLQMLIHHMAFDGLSAPLLIADLNAAYRAIMDGTPPDQALPPLANPYADFAAWQRDWSASPAGTATLERWRAALAGAPELSIATDHPRRTPLSFRAGSHPFALGDRIDDALRGFCARHGVTPFMALAGVFALVMARRSGQVSDVLIGVPYSARRDPRWASTVGLFANMVPLRVQMSPRMTFSDLVRAVRAEAVRVVADGGTPFDQIVREVRPVRDPSRLPLCPVSFQVLHGLTRELPCAGMHMRQLPAVREFTEFEISMFLTDGQGLPGIIEYAADLFEPATIATISAEFQELCGHLLRRPDQPIAAADQHGPRRGALVSRSGLGQACEPLAATVTDAFLRQATARPDAIAVRAGGTLLTYRELDAASDALASRLAAAGAHRGDAILVSAGRGVQLPVALLAVLKAGCCYVPLEAGLPDARVRDMTAATRPALALSESTGPRVTAGWDGPTLDVHAPGPDNAPVTRPRLTGEDRAYVMFTSGTTGTPKALAITHRGIVNLASQPRVARLAPGDVVAQIAPTSFDAATFEIWATLLSGATLAIAPDTRLSPTELVSFTEEAGVTVLHLTAGLLRVIADERPDAFSRLRHLLTGGDVVSAEHLARIASANPRLELTACYGPTEATVFAATMEVRKATPGQPVPLGTPLAGLHVHVLDLSGHPTAPGVPGEIFIGGAGLAHGYLGQPGLTADRFVPDPFSAGGRLYRTGDLGWADPAGVVHFGGRLDRQVKIRGFRVESAEVQAALAADRQVADAVVGVRTVDGETILVGYVVPVPGATVMPRQLHGRLRSRLPEYCLPAVILVLPALPLTGNGKVDEVALQGIPLRAGGEADDDGPMSPTEDLVRAVWADVLGHPGIGRQTDFFDLGGHSLAALRAAGRLERRTGLAVPVSAIFERPTVATLAEWLDTAAPAAPAAELGTDEQLLMELTGASPADVSALLAAFDQAGAGTEGQS